MKALKTIKRRRARGIGKERLIRWRWMPWAEFMGSDDPEDLADPAPVICFKVFGRDAGDSYKVVNGEWAYNSDYFESDGPSIGHTVGALEDTIMAMIYEDLLKLILLKMFCTYIGSTS